MKPGGKAMPPKVNHDRVDSKKKKKKKRSAYPKAIIERKRRMILGVTILMGMVHRIGFVCFYSPLHVPDNDTFVSKEATKTGELPDQDNHTKIPQVVTHD